MRIGFLRRPDREILEHARPSRDRDQDHHTGEEADRVPVNSSQRLVLIEGADKDHDRGPEQRHDRAVELVPDDGDVGNAQDERGRDQRIETEDNVWYEMVRHVVCPRRGAPNKCGGFLTSRKATRSISTIRKTSFTVWSRIP